MRFPCLSAVRGPGLAAFLFLSFAPAVLAAAADPASDSGDIVKPVAEKAESPVEGFVNISGGTSDHYANSANSIQGIEDRTDSVDFTVTLRPKGLDALPNIALRLYVISAPALEGGLPAPKGQLVAEIVEKTKISLAGGQELTLDLGSVQFHAMEVVSAVQGPKGSSNVFRGVTYGANVLEIYSGGALVSTVFSGPAQGRATYQAFLRGAKPQVPAADKATYVPPPPVPNVPPPPKPVVDFTPAAAPAP